MTPLEMLVHHIFPLGFGGNTYPKSRSATTENSITKLKYRKSLTLKVDQQPPKTVLQNLNTEKA